MDKTFSEAMALSKTHILVAICLAHDGYRRAGMAFRKGENALESASLSEAQFIALEADPRIRLELREAEVDDGKPLSEPALVSAPGSVDTADGDKALTSAPQTQAGKSKARSKAKGAAE